MKYITLNITEEPDVQNETLKKLDSALYDQLTQMTEGEPLSIIQGVEDMSGLTSRRLLFKRFNPKTPARRMRAMMSVMQPQRVKDFRMVPKAITNWELKMLTLRKEFEEKLKLERIEMAKNKKIAG